MKTTIKTVLAAFLLLTFSCKKENNPIQPSDITNKTSFQADINKIDVALNSTSIKIGTQKWRIKNLDVSHYRNGDSIPEVKDAATWATLTTGAWCYYNNDPANGAIYGKLYNWYAVNDPRGLAPSGWHIPSDAEWTALTASLGGISTAGGKMKETGTTHWLTPNADATNSSGFTALPGGYRNDFGKFSFIGSISHFASSTASGTTYAWYRNLGSSDGSVYRATGNVVEGFSVRCIKD